MNVNLFKLLPGLSWTVAVRRGPPWSGVVRAFFFFFFRGKRYRLAAGKTTKQRARIWAGFGSVHTGGRISSSHARCSEREWPAKTQGAGSVVFFSGDNLLHIHTTHGPTHNTTPSVHTRLAAGKTTCADRDSGENSKAAPTTVPRERRGASTSGAEHGRPVGSKKRGSVGSAQSTCTGALQRT
jgi:hypothetical protein